MPRLVGCVSVLPRSTGYRGVVLRMFDAFALFKCCCTDLVDHIALVNVRCLGVVSCSSFPAHTHISQWHSRRYAALTRSTTTTTPHHTTPSITQSMGTTDRSELVQQFMQVRGPKFPSSHHPWQGESYQNGSTLQPTTSHKFTHSLTQPPACP
jgi:hypothetical protein